MGFKVLEEWRLHEISVDEETIAVN